jgi:hypothetical protein
MQDIIPWSLIYSAQNDKHNSEIKLLQDKLNNEKTRMRKLAYMMIVNLLNSSVYDFGDFACDSLTNFNAVVDIITKEDIDTAVIEVIAEIDKVTGFINQSAHDDIYRQAQICKSRLP